MLERPPNTYSTVVFLRHGQSTWNEASLFTGWADVELTTLGKNEAAAAATQMWKEGITIDVAYSSRLKRAMQTLDIVLTITGQEDVPINRCWRLNERMYGGLTGLNKKQTAEKFGEEQVKVWRRSYSTRPPDVDKDSQYWPGNDDAYLHIPLEELPLAECLKDCVDRTLPYWHGDIVPALQKGKTVLVAAHGNSIRGLLKFLDGISEEEITSLEIPTGVPLVYHLDDSQRPIRSPRAEEGGVLSGYFLADADELKAKQAKGAAEGTSSTGDVFACFGSGCLLLDDGDLSEAFAKVDGDGDGLIDALALQKAASSLSGDSLTAAEARVMLREVDLDGDAHINFEEFVQVITKTPVEA